MARWTTISLLCGGGSIVAGITLHYADHITEVFTSVITSVRKSFGLPAATDQILQSAQTVPLPPSMPSGQLLSQRLNETKAATAAILHGKLLALQTHFKAIQTLLGLNWSFPDILLRGEIHDHTWVLLVFAPNQPMPIGDCSHKTFVDSRINKPSNTDTQAYSSASFTSLNTMTKPTPNMIHAGGDAITCQRLRTFEDTPALHHAINQWRQQSVATVTLDDWVESPLWANRRVPIMLSNAILDKSPVVQVTQLLRHTTAFATREIDDLYYRKNLENFVALVGAQQWVQRHLTATEIQRYDEELAQRKAFYQFTNAYRQKMIFVMASDVSTEEKKFRTTTSFSDMQTAYEGLKPQLNNPKVYDDWMAQKLHYGHLWLMSAQSDYFPAFERLFEESNHNLVIFFAKALELGKLTYEERLKTLRSYQTKVERDPDVRNVFNGQ